MLNKTFKYIPLSVVCMLTLSACNSNEPLSGSDTQGKTPIELMVGIVGENPAEIPAQTRTVITTDNPYGHSAAAFASATSLYMVIKGDNADNTASKFTRAIGTVMAANTAVSFADVYKRYWEDSYSRDSKLSVYSACVPGKSVALNIGGSTGYSSGNYDWSSYTSENSPTIVWPLSGSVATQNASFITDQDLCFSNNVSGTNSMVFNGTTKKFEARTMIFHHALTRVTFKIAKGAGFSDSEFSSVAISLAGFNTSGTLDISTGEFSTVGTTSITTLAVTGTTADASTYAFVRSCLMLPGTDLNAADKDATDKINITINNNVYHIKKSQLATALASVKLYDGSTLALDSYKMRHGVHYVFTMTISKKAIDKITASVVPWEEVTASAIPSNTNVTVSTLVNGTPKTGDPDFDLYRIASISTSPTASLEDYTWTTGYTPSDNKAHLAETTSGLYTAYEYSNHSNVWTWPDNRTYYHFRTVMPTTSGVTEDATNGDCITLTGAVNYTDVCWGAPFYDTTEKLIYDPTTYGFDGNGTNHQISKAIGATSDVINMEMFHMMSDVTIRLTTSTDANDAVNITGATLSLSNIYPTGIVRMGNGLVIPTGDQGAVNGTFANVDGQSYKQWKYGFVPQPLSGVVLTITTADNNHYLVNMAEVVATAVSNNLIANPYTETSAGSRSYLIDSWYPSYNYIYTFNLTKAGVAKITATIADWETVRAGNDNVQIQ